MDASAAQLQNEWELIHSTTPAPPKIILYGPAGIGKTTFARQADAVLIDCEGGAGQVEGIMCTKYLATWPDIRKWIVHEIDEPRVGVSGIAIDTVDWLVRRIVEYVTIDLDGKNAGDVTNTIGSAHGGFFKAREIVANIVFRDLLPLLNRATEAGLVVILLAHASNVKMTTPEGYDVSVGAPDLPDYVLPIFIEWADGVFYAHKAGENHVVRTEGTGNIIAKNRYRLAPILPLVWDDIIAGMTTS